jgi:hypothetical protein
MYFTGPGRRLTDGHPIRISGRTEFTRQPGSSARRVPSSPLARVFNGAAQAAFCLRCGLVGDQPSIRGRSRPYGGLQIKVGRADEAIDTECSRQLPGVHENDRQPGIQSDNFPKGKSAPCVEQEEET